MGTDKSDLHSDPILLTSQDIIEIGRIFIHVYTFRKNGTFKCYTTINENNQWESTLVKSCIFTELSLQIKSWHTIDKISYVKSQFIRQTMKLNEMSY